MTRKRFVKLLMAQGYSRNKANRIARETVADGYTYTLQIVLLRVGNNFPDITVSELKNALGKVVDAITEIIPTVINTIAELFPVAIDLAHKRIAAMQEAMQDEAEALNEQDTLMLEQVRTIFCLEDSVDRKMDEKVHRLDDRLRLGFPYITDKTMAAINRIGVNAHGGE